MTTSKGYVEPYKTYKGYIIAPGITMPSYDIYEYEVFENFGQYEEHNPVHTAGSELEAEQWVDSQMKAKHKPPSPSGTRAALTSKAAQVIEYRRLHPEYVPPDLSSEELSVLEKVYDAIINARDFELTTREAVLLSGTVDRGYTELLGDRNPNTVPAKLFDWSTYTGPKPAIPSYVFHHTYEDKALEILEDGYIKPSAGSISFTLDPWFAGIMPSVCFVFREDVIRDKYGGKEIDYFYIEDPVARRKTWEQEMEVEVKSQIVRLEDCVEILTGRDANWKYGHGYKYHYKDIRDREYWPWTKFRR